MIIAYVLFRIILRRYVLEISNIFAVPYRLMSESIKPNINLNDIILYLFAPGDTCIFHSAFCLCSAVHESTGKPLPNCSSEGRILPSFRVYFLFLIIRIILCVWIWINWWKPLEFRLVRRRNGCRYMWRREFKLRLEISFYWWSIGLVHVVQKVWLIWAEICCSFWCIRGCE